MEQSSTCIRETTQEGISRREIPMEKDCDHVGMELSETTGHRYEQDSSHAGDKTDQMEAERRLNQSRKTPTCSRCRNHGKTNIKLKGHKYQCDFWDCACSACIKLEQRQDNTADQVFFKRNGRAARQLGAQGLPVRPLPLNRACTRARRKAYERKRRALLAGDRSLLGSTALSDLENVKNYQSSHDVMDVEQAGDRASYDERTDNKNSCSDSYCDSDCSSSSSDSSSGKSIKHHSSDDCIIGDGSNENKPVLYNAGGGESNSSGIGSSGRWDLEWNRIWTKVQSTDQSCSAKFGEVRDELISVVYRLYMEDPRATVCVIREIMETLDRLIGVYAAPPLCTPPSTPPTQRLVNSAAAQPVIKSVTVGPEAEMGGKDNRSARNAMSLRENIKTSTRKERKELDEGKSAWRYISSVASAVTPNLQQIIAHNSLTSTFPIIFPGLNPLQMCPISDGMMKAAYPALDYLYGTSAAKRASFSIDHLSRSSITSQNMAEGRGWSRIGVVMPMGKLATVDGIQSIAY